MKRIVIIGGGFAGVYCAKKLLKANAHVTLVNRTNFFLFVPMLHEVATGGLCGHNLAEPIREVLNAPNFTFIKGVAQSVDLERSIVKLDEQELKYDHLVLSTGSTTNFFNILGAEKNCLTLKGLHDAHRIKSQVIECLEKAFKAKTALERDSLSRVVVIGAGPTGVELAIEMQELLDQVVASNKNFKHRAEVVLVQRGEHILPQLPELRKDAERQLRKHGVKVLLNSPVKEVNHGQVVLDKKAIDAGTIIWTAGVKPNVLPTTPSLANERGCILVNEFLQVPAFPEVFVIGDCATYTQKGSADPLPALAQVATEEGKHVARNIRALLDGRSPEPFLYKSKGTLLSLGKGHGTGIIFGFKVTGFFAWWLNRTIYLTKIIGFGNKLRTAWEWTLNLFTKRDACQH
ncbi:NAD(P)/FAD-dependent oxidoreductase [Candidatus Woesearchaeota archaeon]|nr:NAD(P)/FAD-dependent oxidoreductase [Candidatus Woesearchaeota archaeon]